VINELFGGLENFFKVWVASHELQLSQITQGETRNSLLDVTCFYVKKLKASVKPVITVGLTDHSESAY
jgi:hypothetical protein